MELNNHLSAGRAVQELIRQVQEKLQADGLPGGEMFGRLYQDTLDKAVKLRADGTTFIITGDIPAMWLRDSTCQVRPFLPLAKDDEGIAAMLEGLIRQQVNCILIDPYANAFNEEANGNCWAHDITDMKPELWERKYEIDSLCFPVQLAYLYWVNTGRTGHFDARFLETAKSIVRVFRTEQDHEHKSDYSFIRENTFFTDTLSRGGRGALVNEKAGLIWSVFRPSDDACVYGYLIPSNMFAAVILEYLDRIVREVYIPRAEDAAWGSDDTVLAAGEQAEAASGTEVPAQNPLTDLKALCGFAAECASFAKELRQAIEKEAVLYNWYRKQRYYSYEVDGFGQYLIMDDANLPSLLAMPYIGYCGKDDEMYLATKDVILSDMNPYYYEGKCLKGIGSMHTPARFVWHISLAMQGLVSESAEEKKKFITLLAQTTADTGYMHEGVSVDDPAIFTRPWFSWANMMFCELVMDYCGIRVKTV